jgi:hypothetical protein
MTHEQINAKFTRTINSAAGTNVRGVVYLDGSLGLTGTPDDVKTAADWAVGALKFRLTFMETDEEDGVCGAMLRK